MLNSYRKSYAVMPEDDLTCYSFADESLELCKEYCREGSVITEQLPVSVGREIQIWVQKYHKPIDIRRISIKNIFKIHWSVSRIFHHKTGKIVYRSGE